jgi:hypothetical protein
MRRLPLCLHAILAPKSWPTTDAVATPAASSIAHRLVRRIGFCFYRSRTFSITTHIEGDRPKPCARYRFHLSLPTRPDRRKAVAKDDRRSLTLLNERREISFAST